jgi:hypothetical protein
VWQGNADDSEADFPQSVEIIIIIHLNGFAYQWSTGWNVIVFAKFPQKVGIEQKISLLFDMRIRFR